jgi:hypothetical protein
MEVTRKGFSQVVGNAFAGLGFAPEGPSVYEFPIDMFLAGSDLTPIRENIDKIVYGLTKWEPKFKAKGVFYPAERITVQGKDYQEALANMNLLFLRNLWSDGLPVLPATEERVNWLLTGTDLPRDTLIGKLLPRGGIATPETLAVALAMAGGRPEYMPVLIAAVKAIIDPASVHQSMNATTCSVYPVVIVNGPIAKQTRLNSGYGLIGPDPTHPAGATIGRAIRFLLMIPGGGIPGIGTMSIFGGAARYTNIVFAEDEASLPKDWRPISVERGFPPNSNVVTVLVGAAGERNVNGVRCGTQETILQTLTSVGAYMREGGGNWTDVDMYEKTSGILVLGGVAAQGLSDYGWTKAKVQQYLWEHSKIPLVDLGTYWSEAKAQAMKKRGYAVTDPMPITGKPENIMIVVAGGEQSGHGLWMPVGCCPKNFVSMEIKLPAQASWDALLKQAEMDLGPLPAR